MCSVVQIKSNVTLGPWRASAMRAPVIRHSRLSPGEQTVMAKTSAEANGNRKTSTGTRLVSWFSLWSSLPCSHPLFPSQKFVMNMRTRTMCLSILQMLLLSLVDVCMVLSECYESIHQWRWHAQGIQTKAFLQLSNPLKPTFTSCIYWQHI